MKTRFLRDKTGEIDRNYVIAEDGSYIRDKRTGEKFIPYISWRYNVVSIMINGKYYNQIKICHLQWLAWKGKIPEGFIIHHKDENKLNDHIDNLACMSKSKHRKYHTAGENNPFYGKHHSEKIKNKRSFDMLGEKNPMYGRFGEKCPSSILNEGQVNEIRRLSYIDSLKQKDIAIKFGVSVGCVNGIILGYNWNPDNLTKDELIALFMKGFKK